MKIINGRQGVIARVKIYHTYWQQRVKYLKIEIQALLLAYRDPRVPWYAKVVTAGVVAYTLSPIDIIPDFIPILGYLDDLILVPLGIALALRLIPEAVLTEYRQRITKGDAPLPPRPS